MNLGGTLMEETPIHEALFLGRKLVGGKGEIVGWLHYSRTKEKSPTSEEVRLALSNFMSTRPT